jgi:hypothetical protein
MSVSDIGELCLKIASIRQICCKGQGPFKAIA